MKKALFPGTFDPFTTGHFSIVKRGLNLFDEIVIAIGSNDAKKTYFPLDQRITMIKDLYKDTPGVSVESYKCLTIDFAKQIGAGFILRGVRSVNDFEYERSIADINREIAGIDTYILFTEQKLAHVSSTVIRELLRFGHNVDKFIPEGLNLK